MAGVGVFCYKNYYLRGEIKVFYDQLHDQKDI